MKGQESPSKLAMRKERGGDWGRKNGWYCQVEVNEGGNEGQEEASSEGDEEGDEGDDLGNEWERRGGEKKERVMTERRRITYSYIYTYMKSEWWLTYVLHIYNKIHMKNERILLVFVYWVYRRNLTVYLPIYLSVHASESVSGKLHIILNFLSPSWTPS